MEGEGNVLVVSLRHEEFGFGGEVGEVVMAGLPKIRILSE